MVSCIMGMILSGLLIAFNEPMAKLITRISRRVLGILTSDTLIHRWKMALIVYGTLFMMANAIILKWLYLL
jgi:hypothetical protein